MSSSSIRFSDLLICLHFSIGINQLKHSVEDNTIAVKGKGKYLKKIYTGTLDKSPGMCIIAIKSYKYLYKMKGTQYG